jgi:hypothetical protein
MQTGIFDQPHKTATLIDRTDPPGSGDTLTLTFTADQAGRSMQAEDSERAVHEGAWLRVRRIMMTVL